MPLASQLDLVPLEGPMDTKHACSCFSLIIFEEGSMEAQLWALENFHRLGLLHSRVNSTGPLQKQALLCMFPGGKKSSSDGA